MWTTFGAGKPIELVRQVGPDSVKAMFDGEPVILSRAEADFVRAEVERMRQDSIQIGRGRVSLHFDQECVTQRNWVSR